MACRLPWVTGSGSTPGPSKEGPIRTSAPALALPPPLPTPSLLLSSLGLRVRAEQQQQQEGRGSGVLLQGEVEEHIPRPTKHRTLTAQGLRAAIKVGEARPRRCSTPPRGRMGTTLGNMVRGAGTIMAAGQGRSISGPVGDTVGARGGMVTNTSSSSSSITCLKMEEGALGMEERGTGLMLAEVEVGAVEGRHRGEVGITDGAISISISIQPRLIPKATHRCSLNRNPTLRGIKTTINREVLLARVLHLGGLAGRRCRTERRRGGSGLLLRRATTRR